MHVNFFWNFHSNVYTLTIYFIALNESVGFVLNYRPHPVFEQKYTDFWTNLALKQENMDYSHV